MEYPFIGSEWYHHARLSPRVYQLSYTINSSDIIVTSLIHWQSRTGKDGNHYLTLHEEIMKAIFGRTGLAPPHQ